MIEGTDLSPDGVDGIQAAVEITVAAFSHFSDANGFGRPDILMCKRL
ncbi:MAG: hypothetical protein WAM60_02325 [Candidatus Promineifilaceae bacterium]